MKGFIVGAIFFLMGLIQIPPLVREKKWRDFTVYFTLYILAFLNAFAYVLNYPFPSPPLALTALMNTIYRLLGYEVPE